MRIVDDKPVTFRVSCPVCGATLEYTASDLGFRPWYPKGFVYCPKCGKPIRHHIENKIND